MRRSVHLKEVQGIKTVLVMAFAFFWMATTSHCSLEAIPGLGFLACADTEAKASAGHCEGKTCCSVEQAHYLPHQQSAPLTVFVAAILPAHFIFALEEAQQSGALPPSEIASPPELPTSWQFVFRTALPVRSPSIVS